MSIELDNANIPAIKARRRAAGVHSIDCMSNKLMRVLLGGCHLKCARSQLGNDYMGLSYMGLNIFKEIAKMSLELLLELLLLLLLLLLYAFIM